MNANKDRSAVSSTSSKRKVAGEHTGPRSTLHNNIRRILRPLPEASVLIPLILLAGGAWLFVELADEVVEGSTHHLDERIVLVLRNPENITDPIGPPWVEEIGRDLTALGGFAVLGGVTMAVAGYLLLERKAKIALLVAVAVGGGLLLSLLLKSGFDRPRPELVPHGSYVYTTSFPSGHSMMAAVTFLTLAALLARVHRKRRTKIFLITVSVFLCLAVGVSRVYLGVHWPTDVLAGWTAGGIWALLCWQIARWLQRRGRIERAD